VDARRFVGRAPEQVDRLLTEWVAPVLERYESVAGRVAEPDVRV